MSSYKHDYRSPNFGRRNAVTGKVAIRHIIMHYTGMMDAVTALTRLCDFGSQVSAHYLIDEDGTVFALVDEEARAWHAGVAFWYGVHDLNSTSVGIELVNPGHALGYRPFPERQIAALADLTTGVMRRHDLNPGAVLGHSDCAPGRKEDPGELFPWEALAKMGIGLWPQGDNAAASLETQGVWDALETIGYAVPGGPGADILDTESGGRDVITAFQRRFRPRTIDGTLDAETGALAAAMAKVSAAAIT